MHRSRAASISSIPAKAGSLLVLAPVMRGSVAEVWGVGHVTCCDIRQGAGVGDIAVGIVATFILYKWDRSEHRPNSTEGLQSYLLPIAKHVTYANRWHRQHVLQCVRRGERQMTGEAHPILHT